MYLWPQGKAHPSSTHWSAPGLLALLPLPSSGYNLDWEEVAMHPSNAPNLSLATTSCRLPYRTTQVTVRMLGDVQGD